MAIEIVSFPMKNGGSFHSYVSSPEGNWGDKSPTWTAGSTTPPILIPRSFATQLPRGEGDALYAAASVGGPSLGDEFRRSSAGGGTNMD